MKGERREPRLEVTLTVKFNPTLLLALTLTSNPE